jgi:Tol biopolymer transport system component
MDPDGNNVESLTTSTIHRVVSPVWSPDGNSVAFGCNWGPNYNLCIIDREGLWAYTPSKLNPQPIFLIDPARVPEEFCVGGDALSSLTWSPDGERLAFTCRHSNLEDHLVCTIDLEGEMDCWSLSQRYDQQAESSTQPSGKITVAWSPTDDLLAVSIESRIYLSSPDGQESHFLADGYGAAWSPDGERLVFFDLAGIQVIDQDGTDQQLVYAPPSTPFERDLDNKPGLIPSMATATWSPDGRFIAFTGSWQFDGSDGIYRFDLRTGEVERITVLGDGQFYDPDWSR